MAPRFRRVFGAGGRRARPARWGLDWNVDLAESLSMSETSSPSSRTPRDHSSGGLMVDRGANLSTRSAWKLMSPSSTSPVPMAARSFVPWRTYAAVSDEKPASFVGASFTACSRSPPEASNSRTSRRSLASDRLKSAHSVLTRISCGESTKTDRPPIIVVRSASPFGPGVATRSTASTSSFISRRS
ncbi:MAG: hypothetical protein ACI9OJ_003184 [Myxococcota bacterium]|jgi:hypothetical protein